MLKIVLKKLFWGFFRHLLNDRQYTVIRYWLEFDRFPDLKNPKRFSEKIQYLKLHERNRHRRTAADRIAVRKYVQEKAGEEILIPLIGNYDELTHQVWNSLPTSFVLKANHGSKMIKIVEDKAEEDFANIRRMTRSWQATDYYKFGREWVYKDVARTIVAEELLQNSDGDIPKDYKFFCFHGHVECIQIDFDRFENHTRNLYDRDFNLLPATIIHDQHEKSVQKHPQLDSAIQLAELLSEDFNFIRVDLFLLKNQIYFGELTNFPTNGFSEFSPDSFELKMGQKLKL